MTRYLWDHLIEHLQAAGRKGEAKRTAVDLNWVAARLERSGPAGPLADLALVGSRSRAARRLERQLSQIAHLLAPTIPAHSIVDILYSRLGHDGERDLPRLVNKWPLPDLAHPSLHRAVSGHNGRVRAMAFSADGEKLVTGGDDAVVRVWNVAAGTRRAALTGHTGAVRAVAVAPDGRWLASGGEDRTVRIWGPDRLLGRLSRAVHVLAVSADGTRLAAGDGGGSIYVWDVESGRRRARWRGHKAPVTGLAIGPGWIASAGSDWWVGHGPFDVPTSGVVRVWSPSGAKRHESWGYGDGVSGLIAGDELTGVSGRGQRLVWDPVTLKERSSGNRALWGINAVVAAPDGTWLAGAANENVITIHDLASGKQRAELQDRTFTVTVLAATSDGTRLASGGGDGSVRIWNTAPTGKRVAKRAGSVTGVAVAPDGTWLATAGSWQVRTWDAATGTPRRELIGQDQHVLVVAVTPDGHEVVGSVSQGIGRWDERSGREVWHAAKRDAPATAVAVAPDGRWLAVADLDRSVWLQGRLGYPSARMDGDIVALAIAPDGRWLAGADVDGSVRVWDADGSGRAGWLAHPGGTNALAVAPSGGWLVTGGADGLVRIWDAATHRRQARLTGHTGPVTGVAVAPGGAWIASTGRDASIRIWNTRTGEPAAMMRIDAPALCCAWTPDGKSLFVGGVAGLYCFAFRR